MIAVSVCESLKDSCVSVFLHVCKHCCNDYGDLKFCAGVCGALDAC
jgi:hypothetical protein